MKDEYTPLAGNDKAFKPKLEVTGQYSPKAEIADFINATRNNNSLNTFQEIKPAEEKADFIKAASEATETKDSGQTVNEKDESGPSDTTISDERCKELFGSSDLLDCMARLNSYVFRYKPEAQAKYGEDLGADNDVHVGVMAQELESNPATESTVKELSDGTKTVDTRELTMALTAAVAQMAKRIQELEELVNGR